MKRFSIQPADRSRYALAIAAGLLLAAAFPKIGVAGFAWLAPGLMLFAALGRTGGSAFRIGYLAGLTFHLAGFYWLLLIPVKWAPVAGWLALAAYVALYQGIWVWLCWKIYPVKLTERNFIPLLEQFLSTSWSQRLAWTFSCAVLWVAGEMILARLLSGLPWNLLGTSQFRMLPVIQISSVTGVYGVSFLMVWLSTALFCAGVAVVRQGPDRKSWMREAVVPLLAVTAVLSFGFRQVFRTPPPEGQLKIALVQPSIPQEFIWDPKEGSNRFQQLLQLSGRALEAKPDLLVWPEAAVPGLIRYDTNIYSAITNLARTHRVWLVIGADDAKLRPDARTDADVDYFNSSFLISPEGRIAGSYQKRQLVMFGEYVPLIRWLPFIKYLTPIQGGFTPGRRPVAFHIPELNVKTSVLICFEDVFPHLTREYVDEDTDFLLNLTNNGWFGESAAQWQHAAGAVFRAVENGLPLVRCANNGLTCWVDPQGRLLEAYFPGSDDIYGVGHKIAQVPVLAGAKRAPTFYNRHGDWFGWACVGLAAIKVIPRFLRRRKNIIDQPQSSPIASNS